MLKFDNGGMGHNVKGPCMFKQQSGGLGLDVEGDNVCTNLIAVVWGMI